MLNEPLHSMEEDSVSALGNRPAPLRRSPPHHIIFDYGRRIVNESFDVDLGHLDEAGGSVAAGLSSC